MSSIPGAAVPGSLLEVARGGRRWTADPGRRAGRHRGRGAWSCLREGRRKLSRAEDKNGAREIVEVMTVAYRGTKAVRQNDKRSL